jgi:hypothetical protein
LSSAIEKEATLKQMEQQIQYQDMIENSSHETPFNNGNKFPMGEVPILIAKITINTYENNNTTPYTPDIINKILITPNHQLIVLPWLFKTSCLKS